MVDVKTLYNTKSITTTEKLFSLYKELVSLIDSSPDTIDCTDKEDKVYNDICVLQDSLFDYLYKE